MNDTDAGFLVTSRKLNKDGRPVNKETGVAIFKKLSDAAEWADKKNSCSECQEYTVFRVRDFIIERWVK